MMPQWLQKRLRVAPFCLQKGGSLRGSGWLKRDDEVLQKRLEWLQKRLRVAPFCLQKGGSLK
jgi:hypothetical protein